MDQANSRYGPSDCGSVRVPTIKPLTGVRESSGNCSPLSSYHHGPGGGRRHGVPAHPGTSGRARERQPRRARRRGAGHGRRTAIAPSFGRSLLSYGRPGPSFFFIRLFRLQDRSAAAAATSPSTAARQQAPLPPSPAPRRPHRASSWPWRVPPGRTALRRGRPASGHARPCRACASP